MDVSVVSALVAGVFAAQVMETPAHLQRALRLPLRQAVFAEGGILLGARGRAKRVVGYLGHATLAAAIACVYAAFFPLVGEDHLLAWGAFGALLHFVIGGGVARAVFPVVDAAVSTWVIRPHAWRPATGLPGGVPGAHISGVTA